LSVWISSLSDLGMSKARLIITAVILEGRFGPGLTGGGPQ
jgi:hypothetical protein